MTISDEQLSAMVDSQISERRTLQDRYRDLMARLKQVRPEAFTKTKRADPKDPLVPVAVHLASAIKTLCQRHYLNPGDMELARFNVSEAERIFDRVDSQAKECK